MPILVVEDEVKIAQLIKRGLEDEGFIVDTVADGEQGYLQASLHHYDLITLDLMLPSMDGITICRKLREKNINVPVIILTARDSVKDRKEGLESGADEYITKPFSFDDFLITIKNQIEKHKTNADES